MSITMKTSVRARSQKSSYEAFVAEEQAKAEKPLREKSEQLSKLQQQLNASLRATLFTHKNDDLVLPQYVECGDTPSQITEKIGIAYESFQSWLSGQRITFDAAAVKDVFRRLCFVYSSADITTAATFKALWNYMVEIDGVPEGAAKFPEPVVAAPPANPWLAVEQQESLTREGGIKARKAANALIVAEVRNSGLWEDFKTHCKTIWNYDVTEQDAENCYRFTKKFNLAFDHAGLDRCRTAVLGLLTPDEKLAADLESTKIMGEEYSVKRELVRRQRELN